MGEESDALKFIITIGSGVYNGLSSLKVPGFNFSFMSLFIGLLCLSLAFKLLFAIFSSLSVGGISDAVAGGARTFARGSEAKADYARRAERKAKLSAKAK